MQILEWMKSSCGIEDPDNCLVLNFASNGIKANALILQAAFSHRGKLENYMVLGGDPRANFEFTHIDYDKYIKFSVDKKQVEDRILTLMEEEKIKYIVYNNDQWNRRLVGNNQWFKLNMIFNSKPCFPLSEYEALRHWNNRTLPELGSDFAFTCGNIPRLVQSLPKSRTSLEKIAEERGVTTSFDYEGRQLVTIAEQNCVLLAAIWKDVLSNTLEEERYSTQILEGIKIDGSTAGELEGLADAGAGAVRPEQKGEAAAGESGEKAG